MHTYPYRCPRCGVTHSVPAYQDAGRCGACDIALVPNGGIQATLEPIDPTAAAVLRRQQEEFGPGCCG